MYNRMGRFRHGFHLWIDIIVSYVVLGMMLIISGVVFGLMLYAAILVINIMRSW